MAELTAPLRAQPCAGFRLRKAAQICAYFANRSNGAIEKLKLLNLIYLAERQFLSSYHHPMLFDEFYSLPHGPICSGTLNGIEGVIDTALWGEYMARNGNIVVAVKAVERSDLDHVSDAEMDVISDVWQEYADMTASQIGNHTHRFCPEYTKMDKARIPITYQEVLSVLGEEDAVGVAGDI